MVICDSSESIRPVTVLSMCGLTCLKPALRRTEERDAECGDSRFCSKVMVSQQTSYFGWLALNYLSINERLPTSFAGRNRQFAWRGLHWQQLTHGGHSEQ